MSLLKGIKSQHPGGRKPPSGRGVARERQGESARLRSQFLFWIPPARLWVRQPDELPCLAKAPLSRVLPHPLTREPLLTLCVNVGEGPFFAPCFYVGATDGRPLFGKI